MVRKFVHPLILLTTISALLAACAPPQVQPSTSATAAPAAAATAAPATSGELNADTTGELTVLTVAGAPETVLKTMQADFNTKYPKVTVKINVQAGDFAEAMYAKGAANNLEDIVFNADLYVPPFVDADLLVDMESLAQADSSFKMDDIYDSILGLGRVNSKPGVYMLPSGLDTVQMYYNKTAFEKAGAPLPTADWKWDNLIAACQTLMEKNPETYCFDYGTWWAYFVPWIEGQGGRVLSEDGKKSQFSTPEARAGLQAYADLWQKYKVTPLPGASVTDCFVVQKCFVFFHIPAFINTFRDQVGDKFEWDVQFTPAQPKKHVTGMGTYGFSISKNAKNPQLAWEFLKLMVSPKMQKALYAQRSTAPLLKSLAADPDILKDDGKPPKNMKAFLEGGSIGIFPQTYPVACGGLYSGQVNSAINAMLESIQRGKATVEAATTAADAEIQACLDKAAAATK